MTGLDFTRYICSGWFAAITLSRADQHLLSPVHAVTRRYLLKISYPP